MNAHSSSRPGAAPLSARRFADRYVPSRRTLRGALGTAAVAGLGLHCWPPAGPRPRRQAAPSAVANGLKPEAGPLRLQLRRLHHPGSIAKFQDENKVKIVTTFGNDQEGVNKLANRAVDVDVYQVASEVADHPSDPGWLVQPLNRSYLPDFGNLLTAYQDPPTTRGRSTACRSPHGPWASATAPTGSPPRRCRPRLGHPGRRAIPRSGRSRGQLSKLPGL